ncbi:MAG TPA: FIST N-terminal domain-containing protein [Thermoleophilaceae bacterium]|nr:FIST N-terminal domain-containing protein [Thermoleophilaceae bacterium]
MSARIATGLATEDAGIDSFAEAAGRAALGLGGAPADLVFVFAGAGNLDYAEDGLAHVHERLAPRALVGCGAQGVVGGGRELEYGGVAVWAAALPDADLETFHLETLAAGDAVAIAGMPDLDGADAAFMLVDPYTFPAEPLLDELATEHPGLPVLGGLASAGSGPGGTVLMHDGEIATDGAVGVAVTGADIRPCVSQGARPIGPEMAITAAEGNVIHELASQPALERLKTAIAELGPGERALAAAGLLVGIVIDENRPEYERGDFLIRGLLGADEESGSIAVGERVRVGQTVRMQVRDGESADEDLREALIRVSLDLGGPPAGALLFTCNGRGSHMFSVPDHDASLLEEALAGAPTAGFFCAGEIGPVGNRSFVHGFTATMAVFPG